MKESNYKSYDELPLFLNAAIVAKVLGIAPSSSYELMHEKDFPALRIGNRIVVPKETFIQWEMCIRDSFYILTPERKNCAAVNKE